VFVSSFFDANTKENGSGPAGTDAIQYQRTVLVDSGTSGQFLDKTWIATDIPRAGAGTCTFNALGRTQTIYLTDFSGAQYEVLITDFTPVRKRVVRNVHDPVNAPTWIWTYSITMDVVTIISGYLLGHVIDA